MDSFVSTVTPFAVALVGFIILWGICKAVSNREDPGTDSKKEPSDKPPVEP